MKIETRFDEDEIVYHKIKDESTGRIVDMRQTEVIRILVDYCAGEADITYKCLYTDEDRYENQIIIDEDDLADYKEYQRWKDRKLKKHFISQFGCEDRPILDTVEVKYTEKSIVIDEEKIKQAILNGIKKGFNRKI